MERNRRILSIFLLALSFFEIADSSLSRSSYGESCSKARRCNRRAWLGCYEGRCDCLKPEEMVFDPLRGKCVSKPGETCKYGLDKSEEVSFYEITDCVQNAECNSEGICNCHSKFYESANGTCAQAKSSGEKCTGEQKCSKFDGLECVQGICQCNKFSLYSPGQKRCVGLSQSGCVDGRCIPGAVCIEGKCTCDSNFYHNAPTQMCFRKKGGLQNCTDDSECIKSRGLMLYCVEGLCNCDRTTSAFSLVQVRGQDESADDEMLYSEEEQWETVQLGTQLEMCVPLVGLECPEGYCVQNAKCQVSRTDDYDELKICRCSSQYAPNRGNTGCGKGYGGNCEHNGDCVDDLVCSGGYCGCPLPAYQAFDSERRACVSKVGAHCTEKSICVAQAFCKPISMNSLAGLCECSVGFIENQQGECDIGHGQPCSYGYTSCDTAAKLVCLDRQCACADNKMNFYSAPLRKCVGLTGAHCNRSLENECETNAECVSSHPDLPAKCKCKGNWTVNAEMFCETRFGNEE